MSETLTVTELSRKFAEYVNRVAYRGESFILTKGNRPVAELRPVTRGRKLSELSEVFASLPHLDPDDVEQFAKDIEESRNELNSIPVRDPWED